MSGFRQVDQDTIPCGDNGIPLSSVVQVLISSSKSMYMCRSLAVTLCTPPELLANWLPEGESVNSKQDIALELLRDWRLRNGGNGTLDALINILTQRYGGWEQALKDLKDKWLPPENCDLGSVVKLQRASVCCFPKHEIGNRSSLGGRIFYGVLKNCWGNTARHLAVKTWTAECCRTVREKDLEALKAETNAGIWPNVNKTHYWGLVNNVYFFMSDIALGNIIDFVDKLQIRYQENMISLANDIAAGLDFLHKLNVVHGNIKPENVLVFETDWDKKWVAKLSDYGQQRSQCKDGNSSSYEHLWIPPEGEQEQNLMAGDVYSLGKIIQFCITSYLHWFKEECSLSTYVFEIMNRQLKYSNSFEVYSLQESFHHLVVWMTHSEPQKRPTASQVLLHPFFWSAEKSIQFLVDIGELRWAQIESRECMLECWRKLDRAYAAYIESEKIQQKYSWYNNVCYPVFLQRSFRETSVLSIEIENIYQYDKQSLFSLLELIRYTFRKHEKTDPYSYCETFSIVHESGLFCEKEFAKFWLERFSKVPVALFCGLSTFAQESWMEKLNDKYGVKEYFGLERCWNDKVVGIICKFLVNFEEILEKREKARNVLDESSSEDEQNQEQEPMEEDDIENLQHEKRSHSYIESLEKRLPSNSDIPLLVPETTISMFADNKHKLGSGRNCLVFRGKLENGQSVAVKLFESSVGPNLELERVLEAWKSLGSECKFVIKLLSWSRELRKKTTLYYVCLDLARDQLARNLEVEIINLPLERQHKMALKYITQLKEGIAFLHRNGLAHGDINLCSLYLFDDDGEKVLKLGDLDKSRLEDNWLYSNDYGARWDWVSPEVLLEKECRREQIACTMEADMFSYGMVMYSLLCGCQWHPFDIDGKCIIENIKNCNVKPRSLGRRNYVDAENLMHWTMNKEARWRPTAEEMTNHPFWWNSERTMDFLKNVVKNIGTEGIQELANNNQVEIGELLEFRKKIDVSYKKYHKIMHDPIQEFDWKKELRLSVLFCEKDLEKQMDGMCVYDSCSLLSLLELVVKQFEIQCQLGPMFYIRSKFLTDENEFSETLYLNYILDKFPDLVILLFCVLHLVADSSPVFQWVSSVLGLNKMRPETEQYTKCWTDEWVQTFLKIFQS